MAITNMISRVIGGASGGRRAGAGRGMGGGMGATRGRAGTGGTAKDAAIGRGVRGLMRRFR